MATVADNSANTLVTNGSGGIVGGIPNDGTGTTILLAQLDQDCM